MKRDVPSIVPAEPHNGTREIEVIRVQDLRTMHVRCKVKTPMRIILDAGTNLDGSIQGYFSNY